MRIIDKGPIFDSGGNQVQENEMWEGGTYTSEVTYQDDNGNTRTGTVTIGPWTVETDDGTNTTMMDVAVKFFLMPTIYSTALVAGGWITTTVIMNIAVPFGLYMGFSLSTKNIRSFFRRRP